MTIELDKLKAFLKLVPNANWRTPPNNWRDQFRLALGENFVTIGLGGTLKLTDAGRAIVNER